MAEPKWHSINKAPKGAGQLLLRTGSGSLDPAFVGQQFDDGRWFSGDVEVHPTHYSDIPLFDADDGAST